MTRGLTVCLAIATAVTVSAQTPALPIFKARADALQRIDAARQTVTDPQSRAEMALHWAEAMDRAARAVPFGDRQQKSEPYASWIQANGKYLVYSEPAGQWMLRRDTILNLHRMYPAMDAADDIAWLLVAVGVAGECEGDVPCYVDFHDLTAGEYLRLHPSGRHADEAIGSLREWIASVPELRTTFEPSKDCVGLKRAVTSLRAAVTRSGAYRHEDVERGLDELLGWCR